jgi:hypothetical protein
VSGVSPAAGDAAASLIKKKLVCLLNKHKNAVGAVFNRD